MYHAIQQQVIGLQNNFSFVASLPKTGVAEVTPTQMEKGFEGRQPLWEKR